MGFIRSALPYILAIGGFLLPLFTLLKEWKEYESSKLRRAVLIALCAVTILSLVALHQDNLEKAQSEGKVIGLGKEISGLEGQVKASNKAQSDNTALFLGSLKDLSQRVSDLQSQVTTEALQKKLASVQEALQSTQKALAPGPKAQLSFSFDPPVNSPDGQRVSPSREITLPVSAEGIISVPFDILNSTEVDALDGEVTLAICQACKFVKDPEQFRRLPGEPEGTRNMPFQRILPKTIVHEAVDVIVPDGYANVSMGITYRCQTCDVPEAASQGTVHLARLGRDFLKSH